MSTKKIRFAIVAGEHSGDNLGANLIEALKTRFPEAIFEGVGGEAMKAKNFTSLFPLERLAVMGFWEPLKRLPELLSIRKKLKTHFLRNRPDVFIGIDSPDFNLDLEIVLKKHGIKTVHYVSPTVWAWRQRRIKKVKKAVHLMLSLFPFEMKIYQENKIPICCVGHPLADDIPLSSDKAQARKTLELPQGKKIVALLPGSRKQELQYLAPDFIKTAQWLQKQDPSIQFISACPNEERMMELQGFMDHFHWHDLKIYPQKATMIMAASDVVLAVSGTTTLESMLIKRPTLVAYKMSPITFFIAKRLIKVPYIALPNILANKCIMPEYIQSQVNPITMGQQILDYLNNPQQSNSNQQEYARLHQLLKRNADEAAANAISELIFEGKHHHDFCRSG